MRPRCAAILAGAMEEGVRVDVLWRVGAIIAALVAFEDVRSPAEVAFALDIDAQACNDTQARVEKRLKYIRSFLLQPVSE